MRLALFQPDIPQNTGTLLRTAACLGVPVDVILPAGFDFTDRSLRRAGLDYLEHVAINRHADWAAFEAWRAALQPKPRLILLSSHASDSHIATAFEPDDILLLGRESAGAPDYVHAAADRRVRIPLVPGLRSFNIAIAGAMVIGEALRQVGGFPGSFG
jgi:tRNA (cytidine/uridine-2'-O-)-methyltransferase